MGFLYLVVGGPASSTAWGMVLEKSQIDKHTRDCVRLFLHGLLPRERGGASRPAELRQAIGSDAEQSPTAQALEAENTMVAPTM